MNGNWKALYWQTFSVNAVSLSMSLSYFSKLFQLHFCEIWARKFQRQAVQCNWNLLHCSLKGHRHERVTVYTRWKNKLTCTPELLGFKKKELNNSNWKFLHLNTTGHGCVMFWLWHSCQKHCRNSPLCSAASCIFHRSHVQLHWADPAGQEVKQPNGTKNSNNFQNKTPCADSQA